MSLFNWITGKIRPPAADEPPTPSSIEVLALSGEALNSNTALPLSVRGPSPSSSSVPVRSKPAIEEDATKATVLYAPHASGSHSSFTSAANISQRREIRARNIDLARAGESLRLSSPARNSNLRPLTPYPPLPTSTTTTTTTTAPLVGEDPVPRNEFNGLKKKLENQLQVANTRTQEAYRQLWEQEQRHKSERLNWQHQFSSIEKPLSSRPSKSVQQQTSPHEGQEPSLRVNTRSDKNLGAGQEGDLSLSSPIGLPFKLRKLSTELVLARAEACMILREWSEMEKRSHEAMAMASDLNHEPLTARCWFFLGVACYHLKKWALASDSFEFAKPCVGVYTTAHEFRSWKQKVDSAIGASPAGSIKSMPNSPSCKRGRSAYKRGWEDLGSISSSGSTINTPLVHSTEDVSNIGWMNSESPWSGRSTSESTGDPASPSKDLPLPHKRLLRPRYKKVLSRTLTTTSIPAHRDRGSLPSNPSTSMTSSRDFSLTPDSYRSDCRPLLLPPGSQSGSSSLDVNGSEIAIEYLGKETPPQPRSHGLPLTLVIPDISFSVRPRQSRLYTPDDEHVYPRSHLRQGPRLRLIIPVKTFPGPGPIVSIPLRPSRIYMPDKPDVALYPQKPFRRGERLKVTIPSPEPQTPPLEISRPPATNKLLGYHTMSTSSSAGCSPVQPQRPPSPRRPPGRQVFSKARLSTTSSFGKLPSCPSNPSLPFSRFSYRETSSMFGESADGVSQFIRELSQPGYTKRRPVNNRTSSSYDRTSIESGNSPEEHSQQTYNSAVPSGLRVIKPASTSESSPGRSPPLPKSPGLRVVNRTPSISESSPEKPPPRLRVVNRSSSTPESSPEKPPPRLRVVKRSSSTPESSPGKPPPIPKRPGLRVVNRTPSTSGSSPEKPPRRLRVVNRSSSTPESSPEKPSRRLRVVNRSFSTPENSPKNPPIPNGLRPQYVNRNSSTPESSLDDSSREHAQDSVFPGQASFTPSEGRSMSKGVAVWFPDTGSGCARFLDSPEDNPDGLFITDLTNQYEVEYDDSRNGVPIEIGVIDPPQASTRPDVRQMVWRPPSRDSIQPHGEGVEKRNDSSDKC